MNQKQTTDEILELIRLVDRNKDIKGRSLFREMDELGRGSARNIIGLICIEFSIWVVYFLRQISFAEWIAFTFAFLAIVIAYLSLMMQVAEKEAVEIRFKRAMEVLKRRRANENEKLILKALIKIRSRHKDFALMEVYEKNKDMFTEKKLMEELYD